MATTVQLDIKNKDLLETLRGFLTSVLKLDGIDGILVPWKLPMKNLLMPALITDPDRMIGANPISPGFPMNGAKLLSRLTRKASGSKVAAVLRPCEIRAFTELVKLKQGRIEDVVLIGIDCLGAYRNTDYFKWVNGDLDAATQRYASAVLSGAGDVVDGFELSPACKACEYPQAPGADILIGLFGVDTTQNILVQARTTAGEKLTDGLGLAAAEEPASRKKAVEALIQNRAAYRDEMFEKTRESTDSLEKLTSYLASCVNCYNCRVACPVCYCRECVFVTDVFDHEPYQYIRWAEQKGAVKLPTDTVFYHVTRLAHMSTACVGCGQCSNACPNDIPVMELFRSIAEGTQKGFDYEAGRSIDDKPPLSEFREDEYQEVVGMD